MTAGQALDSTEELTSKYLERLRSLALSSGRMRRSEARTRRQGGAVCSVTQSGEARVGNEEEQGGGGGGGSLPEPVVSTHSGRGRRTGHSREAKILGSFHVGRSLVSS